MQASHINSNTLAREIDAIIEVLNGKDTAKDISPDFLRNCPPIYASNRYAGPTDMQDLRYLILLYASKYIDLFTTFRKKVGGNICINPTKLEKVANSQIFHTHILFRRADAMDTYRRWRKAHFVTIRQGNFVGITERGEEFCRSVITTMISSLPPKRRQQLTANLVTENSLYQSLPFGGQVKIQETIKPNNSLLSLEEYCKRSDIEPVSELKRPNHIEPHIDVITKTYDIIIGYHAFLAVEVLDENIPISELHIIICPLKIKNDDVYRNIIDRLIDQTYDSNINEFCINDARILLTDTNGLSILQNVRLKPDQQYYSLYRDRSALLELFSKLHLLSEFVRLVESGVEGYDFRPIEHCPYCKEYSVVKPLRHDGKV